MSDVQGRFAAYVPVNGMEEDARWSQTDPRATLAHNFDDVVAVGTLTLPAGMVPDCAGVYDIKGPAYMFSGTLAPVHVDPSVDVEVALHMEFDVPDLGRPLEVGLTLSSRAAVEFLPGWTSSLDINPKLTVPVGASNPNAQFTATSLYTDPGNHGATLSAGHHVWDLTVKMRMGQYQIGATFDLTLYCVWDVPTPLAPLAAEQVVTSTVTATVTAGAVAPPTPSVLHFRDPADGVFKPLTEIRVPGFDDPPAPDLGDALIQWGTDTALVLDYAAASIHGGPMPGSTIIGQPPAAVPPEGNLRVSPLSDGSGLRVQADSWLYEVDVADGFMGKTTVPYFESYIEIPVLDILHTHDARSFKPGSPKITGPGVGLTWGETAGEPGAGVPAPNLSATTGAALAWSLQRWVYPAEGTTGAVSLDLPTYAGATVTITSGTALAALVNPVVRIRVATGGAAAETPAGHYSTGALALDAEVRPVLVSQIAVAP